MLTTCLATVSITDDIRPAVSVVRAAVPAANDNNTTTASSDASPKILVHAFSNGGSSMLSHLRRACGDSFPRHVTIFDSAPGQYSFERGHAAVTAGMGPIMRTLILPFNLLAGLMYHIWFLGRTDSMRFHANVNNEVKGELSRAYIYSETDKIVDWREVEEHTRDAKKKGYNVRVEKFEGSRHVSHVMSDEKRYWEIVESTWKNGFEAKP